MKPFYKQPLFIVIAVIFFGFLLSLVLPFFRPLYGAFFEYLKMIWWAIILGLVVGGAIDYFVPSQYIRRYLTQRKKITIIWAVSFGFLMSACSHGILAIAMELYKKGASVPAVISFLLASPWANLPVTIILFGFFGIKALLLVIFAIIIAIITGFIYQILDKKNLIEKKEISLEISEDFSLWQDLKKRVKRYKFNYQNLKNSILGTLRGTLALTKMVLWWILIGMFLASLAQTYIPQDIFQSYMGPGILGLLLTLILAIIIEVCSEGSSPLAFEIFRQTGAFGNSFVFLMAGVATDYTEIGLIWTNIGKRAAIWLPIVTVPQILILGYLFNLLI